MKMSFLTVLMRFDAISVLSNDDGGERKMYAMNKKNKNTTDRDMSILYRFKLLS